MVVIQEDIMKNIIAEYKAGNSPNKISKVYTDYSPYVIRENLKHSGVFETHYFIQKEVDSIKTDYINGMSLYELSKKI